MQQLLATYFDGQSAQAQAVSVTVQSDFLTIHFIAENSPAKPMLIWQAQEVLVTQNTTLHCEIANKEATLLLQDKDAMQVLQNYWGKNHTALQERSLFNFFRRRLVLACLAALGILAIGYFFILPIICDAVAENMPYSYEKELGDGIFTSLVNEEEIDSARTIRLQNFANSIDFGYKKPLKFYVVNGDVKNAFAVPGGSIVVYTKLLQQIPTKEALAALLSHEVAHQKNKHALKGLVRGIANYAFIAVITNDINGLTTLLLEYGGNLKQMKFSRSLETEADTDGLQILYNNQISQEGFVELFDVLSEDDGDEKNISVPELLSTHPLTENRRKMAEETAKKQSQIKSHVELENKFQLLIKN